MYWHGPSAHDGPLTPAAFLTAHPGLVTLCSTVASQPALIIRSSAVEMLAANNIGVRIAMSTPIHVSVAWPYANGDLHVGHLAGALLPADIFARYHRLKGHRVLMVSGSDAHGTPLTVEADRRGLSPRHLFEHYHHRFLETQAALGISYDVFTHTDTENHHRVAQEVFLRLYKAGYLSRQH